jgi:hypothetical protein
MAYIAIYRAAELVEPLGLCWPYEGRDSARRSIFQWRRVKRDLGFVRVCLLKELA